MQMKKTVLLILLNLITSLSFAITLNIVDFGAKSDTTIVCTEAIQRAIDSCNRAGEGLYWFLPEIM